MYNAVYIYIYVDYVYTVYTIYIAYILHIYIVQYLGGNLVEGLNCTRDAVLFLELVQHLKAFKTE